MKLTLRIIVLSFLAGISGAYTFQFLQPHEEKPAIQTNLPLQQTSTRETYTTAVAASPDFVAASAISTPSVVYIKTASTAYAQQDFFDFFFGGGGREQKVISSGSGVIF